jgi:hypothetical protein
LPKPLLVQASWGSNIADRLAYGSFPWWQGMTAAGKSTLYSSYGVGGATFLTELISGESAIDAARQGLKVGAAHLHRYGNSWPNRWHNR